VESQYSTRDLDSGDTDDSSQHMAAGTTLADRYLIQGVLGIGGMSAVYRARDMHFPNVNKFVAVKEMINRAMDPVIRTTIVRNFEREANLLASLNHRGIPRIYDYFSINERSYLILEFIDGRDLEVIINDDSDYISESNIVQWAIELCDVLSYLHNHKPEAIIFRDMKPSNVMITPQNHVVLVDFGIAKHFQAGQRGTMIGTEGYSPPEQYRGEATPLADIYALGATLHHALTKRDPRLEPPFSFNERPIRQINPNLSPRLEEIINISIQYNAEDRYQSTEAMKDALLDAAQEIGIETPIPISTPTVKTDEGLKPLWTFECEDEIRGSPTYHNGIIYIGCYDNNMYALDSRGGNFIWKYPTEGGVVSKPVVFEDSLIFGSEDHRLHSIYARTGKLNWLYYTNGPIRSSPYLAESHVFIGSDDTYLYAINAITGRHTWKIDAGSPIRSTPTVHGEYVYFGSEAGDFYCLDFGGTIKWRHKARRAVTSSPVLSRDIVYFGSVDCTFYALDANTGWVVWRFRLNKPTISTPFVQDNWVYTGAIDGNIYCIDAGSAREVWKFSTQNQVTGSPIVYKDSLYIGSVDGFFYCLESRTGHLNWKYQTKGPITGTPAVNENLIYIGSMDHYMYAFLA
jgi:serine/threonine protein kinase